MGHEQPSLIPEVTRRRPLGRTKLSVTPICIGTTALGNMPETYGFGIGENDALAILDRIFSKTNSFNFVDTAAIYGDSEERIGRSLRERGGLPPGMVLSTKIDRDPQTGDFSGGQVKNLWRKVFDD